MRVREITAGILLIATIGSSRLAGRERSFQRYLLSKEGGAIEVETILPNDKETRDAVRKQLQEEARNGITRATSAMQQHKKEIRYRYEETVRGGRIRISAKTLGAILAVQDFLRLQMSDSSNNRAVGFDFIGNTSLVVLPVTINDHGPYRFLFDTGASNTVLSTAIADRLGVPRVRDETLLTAGGGVPVTIRNIKLLQVGAARLENIEIAVADFDLMKRLQVDGVLGGDYLRRFKVSIDYGNRLVHIELCCSETMSMLAA